MSGRSHSGHKEKRGTRYYLERWLFLFSFSISFFLHETNRLSKEILPRGMVSEYD